MRRDLVEAARRGDHEAFEVLATSSGDRLYAVAFLILRTADLAEDAVQEALVRAWQQLPSLRDPDRFDAWLYRLVVNACADQGRQRRRWSSQVRLLPLDAAIGDHASSVATRDQLERGFRRLKPEQRSVLVLHHYSGFTAAEIARILGIPEGTARSRLYYATAALRAALEADGRQPVVAQDGTSEMDTDRQFDGLISSWMEEAAPTSLPTRALDATFERTRRSRQQAGWLALPGRTRMTRSVPALGGAAIVVIVAALTLNFYFHEQGAGGPRLPTTPDAWSRVLIETAPDRGYVIALAASPRGLLAIVGDDQAVRLVASADGRNWTLVPAGQHPPLHGLFRGSVGMAVVGTDRGFLMVGEEGVWTSEDGYTWQRLASAAEVPDLAQGTVLAAAVGGPGFVAVGLDGKAWYATDGSDWTLAEVPPTPIDYLQSLAVVGDQMVAVGSGGVWASGNGRSWTDVTGPKMGWGAVAGGPGGFVAVNTVFVGASADGRDWEEVAVFNSRWPTRLNDEGMPVELGVESVAATTAGYVAVGTDGACVFDSDPCPSLEAVIWASPDGRSWSRLPSAERFDGAGARTIVAWGSRFVVGGTYDDRPAVWISGLDQLEGDIGADSMPTEAPTSAVPADVDLVGTWKATDPPPDRSNLTMEITALADETFEVTILDDGASVCDGTSSTMTGVAESQDAETVVIAQPDYTCDSGRVPQALSGHPSAEPLRGFSLTHDPRLDALHDSLGLEWARVEAAP